METIITKLSNQLLINGKFGWLNYVQRVEFSENGIFSAGRNLYYPGQIAYLKVRSTYIITWPRG